MKTTFLSCILACTTLFAGDPNGTPNGTPNDHDHTTAFEQLKSLEGTWTGTNAEGQKITYRYEVIGNGSALLEQTTHYGHGNQTDTMKMATLYTLDQGKIRLTHYCAAGNQPSMAASHANNEEIEFDFVSATGLSDPNDGHMHHAIIRFEGKDQFSTDWTYHRNGQSSFTAAIKAKRDTEPANTGS